MTQVPATPGQAPDRMPEHPPQADERVSSTGTLARLLKRPEMGAVLAAVVVLVFFSVTTDAFFTASGASTWIEQSSTIGIMAVAVALLMIGGEFDLSAGVMTGFSALTVGVLTTHWGWNAWPAIVVSLLLCAGIGALNGFLVLKTGLPSFIVTLATFFVLQGIDLALVKLVIGQVSIQGFNGLPGQRSASWLFTSYVSIGNLTLWSSFWWWLAVTAAATFVLLRTSVGNWIFAVGGAVTSARQVGVPVFRTKIALFMGTAICGWLVGMLNLFRYNTAQSSDGVGLEFIFIICAVVGGCVMTGGYGSAVGAAFGALIYGMVNQGIPYEGWDSNWLYAFLGVMLLAAVLLNNWVKTRAENAT
ncbi:ABC transporter permease [Flexivirga aerilata]|nr:ABC transporter permease [Flexivirga aerilata]